MMEKIIIIILYPCLSKIIPDPDRRRCSIFNLLAYEAFKFVTATKLAKPSCIESGLDLPTWFKFVETMREKDAAGRIHKDDLHDAVNRFFGEPVLEKALLDNLGANGVQYERALKYGGKRGFFIGVMFKPEEQVAISSGLSVVFGGMMMAASSPISDITDELSSVSSAQPMSL